MHNLALAVLFLSVALVYPAAIPNSAECPEGDETCRKASNYIPYNTGNQFQNQGYGQAYGNFPPPPGAGVPPPGAMPPPPQGPGMDPLMMMMLLGDGDMSSMLPFFLMMQGGMGGGPGGMNPLMLMMLMGNSCKEKYDDCTVPNNPEGVACGIDNSPMGIKPCCTCSGKKGLF